MSASEDTVWSPDVEILVSVVPRLSLARNLNAVMEIVRHTARALAHSDGATFVLRDGNLCHYADEDAIEPLWKGKRFPMSACISGWSMMHRETVYIPDIYQDSRIPQDAYRPTFVHSLLMVPIRREAPVGAIGNYWAKPYKPSAEQTCLLMALADATSLALENVKLYQDLQDHTIELQRKNENLSHFMWAAAHDFQEPLRNMRILLEQLESRTQEVLDEKGLHYLQQTAMAAYNLQTMATDMLTHSQVEQENPTMTVFPLQEALRDAQANLSELIRERGTTLKHRDLPQVCANRTLITLLLQNLLSNAVKFARDEAPPCIEIQAERKETGVRVTVSDNGIGIASEYAEKIFQPFYRLHSKSRIPGSGLGLFTCRKIVNLHGGELKVHSNEKGGSDFIFYLQGEGG